MLQFKTFSPGLDIHQKVYFKEKNANFLERYVERSR